MKTIRLKISVTVIAIMAAALLLVGGIACVLTYTSIRSSLEQTMGETVKVAATNVTTALNGYRDLLNTIAIQAESGGLKERDYDKICSENSFIKFTVTDKNGVTHDGGFVGDTDYFQACTTREDAYISDPIREAGGTSMCFAIASPIHRNDTFSGIAVAFLDGKALSDIVADIRIGSGNAAILDKYGNTTAYEDYSLVLSSYNTQQEAKKDPSLEKLASIEKKMTEGYSGFDGYTYGGVSKFMAYAPIPGTNGWSIDVSVVQEEFVRSTYDAILVVIILSVVMLALAAFLVMRLANTISNPIRQCVTRIESLAHGDLKSPVEDVNTKDETKILADATRTLVTGINDMISDMDDQLHEMGQGNFCVESNAQESYVGDFVVLLESMTKIRDRLNVALSNIDASAEQVSAGSEQVSAGAQALSQGATEQASAVEELAATINEISNHVGKNAENAKSASDVAVNMGHEMEVGSQRMKEMMEAMDHIKNSSQEIGKIIKTIEDIAFQTNILALNAAVEAARAGDAGKGFAVVADEVRNLASKSDQAAKATKELIEDSILAVDNGTSVADKTAEALSAIVEDTKVVTTSIEKIARATQEQSESLAQVTEGIDQIASVVQTNSATAEESAATSEELSSQAETLKNLVGGFKLKPTAGGAGSVDPYAAVASQGLTFDEEPAACSAPSYSEPSYSAPSSFGGSKY